MDMYMKKKFARPVKQNAIEDDILKIILIVFRLIFSEMKIIISRWFAGSFFSKILHFGFLP